MNLGTTLIGTLEQTVKRILLALDSQLTIQENFRAVQMSVTSPGVANTEFTVTHNLGRTPTCYIANVDGNAVIYDSRRVNWTASVMYLKSSGATTVVHLTIM